LLTPLEPKGIIPKNLPIVKPDTPLLPNPKPEMYNNPEVGTPSIKAILPLLISHYRGYPWRCHDSPLAVLILTILSQNTSDVNSHRAYKSLTAAFPSWEEVAAADAGDIAAAIRGGGLGDIKAGRIKAALAEIKRQRGGLELDFLSRLPLDEARDWLKRLPGVGVKTASCVLLFSLGMPALPVDTHVLRVAKRLGLLPLKATAEQSHRALGKLVPAGDVYPFHMLMIEHGRTVCRAQHPQCPRCALGKICPSRDKLTAKNVLK